MGWNGVYPVDKNKPCNICGSIKEVCHRQVMIESEEGCVESPLTHVQSSICQECALAGWIFLGVNMRGVISYYNIKTKEFKNV